MRTTRSVQPKRPPYNALMLAATHKVAAAIEALSNNGMTVVSVALETPARPTIRIQTSAACQTLISNGEAAYFSFGRREHQGAYREGQFTLGGCRIVWTENGN